MSEEKKPGGARERKREETLRRITEAGLKLFGRDGYDATTLDEIAAEAGISRRTFFHYFKSKDDILLSLQKETGAIMVAALAARSAEDGPLAAVRRVVVDILSGYPPGELLAMDRLMRSSAAVQARKHASYVENEKALFAALCAMWPEKDKMMLRMVALLSVGATRLSLDTWSEEGGVRPIADVVSAAFDGVQAMCTQQND